jgi:hypothetical protein
MKLLTLFIAVALSIAPALNVAYGEVKIRVCIKTSEEDARLVNIGERCNKDEYRATWIVRDADEYSIAEDLVFKAVARENDRLTCYVYNPSTDEIIPSQRYIAMAPKAQYDCPPGSALANVDMDHFLIGADCIQLSDGELVPPQTLITVCEILWD